MVQPLSLELTAASASVALPGFGLPGSGLALRDLGLCLGPRQSWARNRGLPSSLWSYWTVGERPGQQGSQLLEGDGGRQADGNSRRPSGSPSISESATSLSLCLTHTHTHTFCPNLRAHSWTYAHTHILPKPESRD